MNKTDMLHETYLIKIIKVYICMVHSKQTNLRIFLRKYVRIKSGKFRWYHVNCPLTIELVRELF